MNRTKGFTLIELIIVLIVLIFYSVQFKIILENFFVNKGYTDSNLTSVVVGIIFSLLTCFSWALYEDFAIKLLKRKNIFIKLFVIIISLFTLLPFIICVYYFRDSILFLIPNLVVVLLPIFALKRVYFDNTNKNLKK